jgi:hypothetical protein
MVLSIRSRFAVMVVAAATVAGLVGCSSSGMATSSGTTTAGQSASPSNQPQVTSAALPTSLDTQVNSSAGGIDVTVTAQSPTTVRPGREPMRFTITLVNTTTTDLSQVGMVVSLGHCSCSPPGAMMMPAGSMRMLDPATKGLR